MPPLSDEQKEESKKRVDEFRTKMADLSKELEIDIFSYPQYIPNQDGTFRLAVIMDFVDKKYMPTISPLSDEIIKK